MLNLELARAFERTEFLLQSYYAQASFTDNLATGVIMSVQNIVDLATGVYDLRGLSSPRHTPDEVYTAINSLVATVHHPSFTDQFQDHVGLQETLARSLRTPALSTAIGYHPQDDVQMSERSPRSTSPASNSLVEEEILPPFSSEVSLDNPTTPASDFPSLKRPRAESTPTFPPTPGIPPTSDIPVLTGDSPLPRYRRNAKRQNISAVPLSTIPSTSSQDASEPGQAVAGPSQPTGMRVFPSTPPAHQILRPSDPK